MKKIKRKILHGLEALAYVDQIANFRINLFAEFPYLYKGLMDDELLYLSLYTESKNSTFMLFFDDNELVGLSSSIPLTEEWDTIKRPFIANNLDVNNYLYIADIMAVKGYGSLQLVSDMFKCHKNTAVNLGLKRLTALTVDRSDKDPARPASYKDLDKLWSYFGWYKTLLKTEITWLRIDTGKQEANVLSVLEMNLIH